MGALVVRAKVLSGLLNAYLTPCLRFFGLRRLEISDGFCLLNKALFVPLIASAVLPRRAALVAELALANASVDQVSKALNDLRMRSTYVI